MFESHAHNPYVSSPHANARCVPCGAESDAVFESVRWLLPDALALGASQVEGGDEAEGCDQFSCLLLLQGWAPGSGQPPQAAKLCHATPGYIEVRRWLVPTPFQGAAAVRGRCGHLQV